MRTRDPKSLVSVGAAAPDPPTRLFVTYMSAQEQSNKLEAIAIKGFIIFSATACFSPRAGRIAWLPQGNYRAAHEGNTGKMLGGGAGRPFAPGGTDQQARAQVGRKGAGNAKHQ